MIARACAIRLMSKSERSDNKAVWYMYIYESDREEEYQTIKTLHLSHNLIMNSNL